MSTSSQNEKPEALGVRGSAVAPKDVHATRPINTLESLISLALIALVVWFWIKRDDE